MTKKSNNEKILIEIKNTINVIKSFKNISTKNENAIRLNDIRAKTLGNQNIKNVNDLSEELKNKKLYKMLDVMYTNFEIVNSSFNIFQAYTDEYLERFKKIQSSFVPLLQTLESKIIEEESKVTEKGQF